MEKFITEWNKSMETVRRGEPLPHNCRIQFLNDKILYSPNCQRDVRIPPTPDPTKNPFLPSLYCRPKKTQELLNQTRVISSASTDPSKRSSLPSLSGPSNKKPDLSYDFTEINLSIYMQPFWWTEHWGWAAFIPRRVNYSLRVFTDSFIDKLPLEGDLHSERIEIKDDKGKVNVFTKYSLETWQQEPWSTLENNLLRVVHHLTILTKASYIGPPLPWVFGYKKSHRTRWQAHHAIKCSRDWFAVWIGLISYLVCLANKMHESSDIADWRSYLVSVGFSPQWIQSLSTAVGWDYGDTRVGVFFDLLDNQAKRREPLIDWLTSIGIPVWYFLDLSYATHPTIGPSYIHFNAPSSTNHSPTMLVPAPVPASESISSTKTVPWQEFFKKREERNKKWMEKETPEQRRSRQDREKNPPTTSAKVYIWTEDDAGTLVRELVCRRERADTLAMYAEDEIKYDSFSNEYDCCEDFGSGMGLSKQDISDMWDDYEGDFVVNESDMFKDMEIIVNSTQPTLLLSGIVDESVEAAREWLPSHVANQSADNVFNAEQEILDILRIHFGYTLPLPVPPPSSSSINETEQKSFLRIIGVAHKTIPSEVFESPNILAAVGFVRRLCQQQISIPDNEWDLNRNHSQSLVFNQRVKCIQTLRLPSPEPTIFMFDFGTAQTVTWKLAVTSASDALMICRLDPEWDEVAIALFLLQNGIPFNTLQSVSTFPRPRTRPIQYPSRPPHYQFDEIDYDVYLEDAKLFLKGPRGRVALMMGGYMWRLAVALVSFETVFEGPTGRSSALLTVETEDGEKYFDDRMTAEEADVLCGLHYCQTGQGDQIAKKSWYPLQQAYDNSGHDYRRWTSNSEAIFKIFDSRNLTASKDSTTPRRQPLPANKWRDACRGSGDTRRARQQLEKASLAVISNMK